MNKKRTILLMSFILLFSVLVLLLFRKNIWYSFFSPRQQENVNQKEMQTSPTDANDVTVVATNLTVPWEIAFLPNGDMLVTERSGTLLKIGAETKKIQEIEGVKHIGEGGLLGLAIHPNFAKNSYIYLYSTTQTGKNISNRVERYTLQNDTLTNRTIILKGIAGSANHDGGRIAFGPDGYLYITTGDAENQSLAQDKNSLNGKILRIKDDGSIPIDNPFSNAVYSLGHRNPQGLAWDDKGTLWETEHGPSGIQTGYDEVNTIIKGGNYGWPLLKGDQKKDGYISPIIHSGSSDTWAPSGLAYWDGRLFFSGLRGEALYELDIKTDNPPNLIPHFKREFGRIRAVTFGKDGFLYISTSNTDGRGQTKTDDDKIIRIRPQQFK